MADKLRPVSAVPTVGVDFSLGASSSSEQLSTIPLDIPIHSWANDASSRQHFWFPPEKSKSESCGRCKARFSPWDKDGFKCAACHVRVHQSCSGDSLPICRPTFVTSNETNVDSTPHHWIMGHFQQKKCIECGKSVRQALGVKDKSYRCAWCKSVVHKDCFDHLKHPFRQCELGDFRSIVLPASSIILAPKRRRGLMAPEARSRVTHSVLHTGGDSDPLELSGLSTKSQSAREGMQPRTQPESHEGFKIVPTPGTTPLLVFINPKSGGNQGVRLFSQFMWWLNPRQVFNLMALDENGKPYGPRRGLELYKDVPGLQVLVCGGDGTVGWVLETLDKMGLAKEIPVATVPLGTGNDLARELKWGGGYDGVPIHRILTRLMTSTTTKMDRWKITVTPGESRGDDEEDADVPVQTEPPQSVFNNYFSIGSDAYTTLKFHLKREAKPKDQENSRLGNKMTYALHGARDIIRHKFKHLSADMTLTCDGLDYTPLLVRKGIEAVAMLNISSYAAGTRPWGTKGSVDKFVPPALDDGLIEVVGFENAWEMAKGQMRMGHALRICQCSKVEIVTKKSLPIQVDGEPCMLHASTITVTATGQATMLCRPKGRYKAAKTEDDEPLDLSESEDDETAFAPSEAPNDLEEDAEDDLIDVYYVPMDYSNPSVSHSSPFSRSSTTTCRSGEFKKLGSIVVKLDATLEENRSSLEQALHVPFHLEAGWRYLAFCKSQPNQPGYFTVVTKEEESVVQLRAFARPLSDVRPGLFICQLDTATPERRQSTDAAFLQAVADGSLERVVQCMEGNANLDAVDEGGRCALHLAAARNNTALLTELLRHMQPNPRDFNGRTPLHVAALSGNEACCRALIDHGADPRISDQQGQRPLDLALHTQYPAIIKLLAQEENKQPDLETIV